MTEAGFVLHPQLQKDTLAVGDLPLSRLLLIDDATYPWLLLVPRRAKVCEIVDLATMERHQLLTEIAQVSEALKTETQCDKLNVAALGNAVPQLHVHVIARFKTDAAWPKPVWGQTVPIRYDPAASQDVIARLRARLFLVAPAP